MSQPNTYFAVATSRPSACINDQRKRTRGRISPLAGRKDFHELSEAKS